ncbi:alpha-2,8-sialyltransferase 8E-like isoform X2 [Hippocampus zosterae]|uniref:alpha-2,8-sialyltransferase 8E-like isoform X2 n=1 Tax=Hippocampus zosterae TaxID=109293 RepID=UPI00223D4007|nr:alpha-2,8-sialyltransferase 8E-like isoform X2 [Hippocampus zosterae]
MASCRVSAAITLLCLCLFSNIFWYMIIKQRKGIDDMLKRYSKRWEKNEENYRKFTSKLSDSCRGFERAIVTQANTPVGTKLAYDGEINRMLRVTPDIFKTFIKEHPFSKKAFNTCAVVGNGAILTDSGCGKMIDSARYVIRCNLPPLTDEYSEDVGVRTDLVTANPSIFVKRYNSLFGRRRDLMERLQSYGKSPILVPAFSFISNTQVALRLANILEDLDSPSRAIFFNPDYLNNLSRFWAAKGLKTHRLSTGFMMASLALELCSNVHLYGFWPFSKPPHGLHALPYHYYDDPKPVRWWYHAMPAEFDLLLKLHSLGVLRLHLGRCPPVE